MRLGDLDALKEAVIYNFDNLQAYFLKDFIEEIDQCPTMADCDNCTFTKPVSMPEWERLTNELNELDKKVKELERPQGEWQYTTHHARRYRICSFCKSEKEDDRSEGWFYCWHCGAKMKGGKE